MTTKTIAQQLNITKFPFEIKDEKGNEIYYENSKGYWQKYQYDEKGKKIYYEDSNGNIIDKRPKQTVEITLDEIAKKFNIDISQVRIKD